MFITRTLIAASLAFCAAGAAHATTDYSASMKLPDGLPKLLTGSQYWDSFVTIDGQWTNDGRANTNVLARDISGYTTDPVTQQVTPVYGDTRYGGNKHWGGPLSTMMESRSHVSELDNASSGVGYVFWDSLSATARVKDVNTTIVSEAVWSRDFSIAPQATFTFSATSTLSILGDAAPLVSQSAFNFDLGSSFASMVMSDAAGRVRNLLGASITSLLPTDLGGVFGFSFGPNGLMSLTVTNTTTSAMTGTLSAGSYVNISAPVPEPETIATMLAGLALVGAVVRRRRRVGQPDALAH